jgi:DNA polymerase-3 subunit delta'
LIKIKPVRERVVEVVTGRPFEGLRRVWIFDGVEGGRFGSEAANAFLKTLEEPPEHAFFVLLAANPDAVIPTIRSRCQQLLLPGAVAVARQLLETATPPELAATALAGAALQEATEETRVALSAGRAGEPQPLLRLPYALPESVPPFAVLAAVAVELASETDDEEFARLAADLLVVERRTRGLNLNIRSQLVSCLMHWQRALC